MRTNDAGSESVELALSALVCAVLLLRDGDPALAQELEAAVEETVGRSMPKMRRKALEAIAGATWLTLDYEPFALDCALLAASSLNEFQFIFADPDASFPVGYLYGRLGSIDGGAKFEFCESYRQEHAGKAYSSKPRLTIVEKESLLRLAEGRPEVFFSELGELIVRDCAFASMPSFGTAKTVVVPADILHFEDGKVVRRRIGTVAMKRAGSDAVQIDADPAVMMSLTAASFGTAWLSVNPAFDANAKRNRQPRLFFRLPSPERPGAPVYGWSNAVISNSAFDLRKVSVGVPLQTAIKATEQFPWLVCADERCLMRMLRNEDDLLRKSR